MSVYKRKRSNKKIFRAKGRAGTIKKRFKARSTTSLRAIAAKVNKLSKTIKTKSGVIQISDDTEYLHNTLYNMSSIFPRTNQGDNDNENSQGQRVGDKLHLVGVSFTMMLELNERYSDVTFRMMVVRSAKGNTPDGSSPWQGASGNKMLYTFNTQRYSILRTKYVKITSPFFGVQRYEPQSR